jgi:hypothetical protein
MQRDVTSNMHWWQTCHQRFMACMADCGTPRIALTAQMQICSTFAREAFRDEIFMTELSNTTGHEPSGIRAMIRVLSSRCG